MILCIDIGNSRIKGARFDDGNDGIIVARYSLPTPDRVDELAPVLRTWSEGVSAVASASVVPDIGDTLGDIFSGLPFIAVRDDMDLPFEVKYAKGKLGADRVAAAAGAYSLFPGHDVIIVDAGTALTFGVLLRERIFDGGLITAGPVTAIEALGARASQLSAVEFIRVDHLVSRSTEDALRAGFYHGYCALVEGIAARIDRSYGREFKLLVTGGAGEVIACGLERSCVYDADLSLKGLYSIYSLNK
jgi:type III pantothenate kinase